MERDTIAVILAAGEGTRMKSEVPKILHKLCGLPIINYSLDNTAKLSWIKETLVILGYKAEEIKSVLPSSLKVVIQREQLGTGHALMQIKKDLEGFKGNILVLCADAPLLTLETLENLYQCHKRNNAAATILTAILDNPKGYGRMVRDKEGYLKKIIEELDATSLEREITEVNTSIYCFNWPELLPVLDSLELNQKKGEYYLTDCVEKLIEKGLMVTSFQTKDPYEALGINNRLHLSEAESKLRRKILENLMLQGITILDLNSTFIDQEVKIEQDTIIYPYTIILGNTFIKNRCLIGPSSCVINSQVETDSNIFASFIVNSHIERETTIGPYNYFKDNQQLK
ncbi:NTP transferase domain-containing protein [bacterium]|nr:NTP transferase domain-containing protein [bacterium]MBU1153128.1 NTP transferase domain-containing protein [bacterium]